MIYHSDIGSSLGYQIGYIQFDELTYGDIGALKLCFNLETEILMPDAKLFVLSLPQEPVSLGVFPRSKMLCLIQLEKLPHVALTVLENTHTCYFKLPITFNLDSGVHP